MAEREPLYRGVKQYITDALRAGKWKHGQRIASESQLAARYGVSVGTIRKAVGELEAENILVREQGRGTFVSSHTRDYMLNVFFRLEDREGRKELPAKELLSMHRGRADRATAAALGLGPRAPVLEIETLLTIRDRPTVFDRTRLPAFLFSSLTEQQWRDREGTVYGMFQQRFGITVVQLREYITAVAADERAARVLGVARGAPLLRIERTAYTYKDQPVDFRIRLVDSRDYGYMSRLGKG